MPARESFDALIPRQPVKGVSGQAQAQANFCVHHERHDLRLPRRLCKAFHQDDAGSYRYDEWQLCPRLVVFDSKPCKSSCYLASLLHLDSAAWCRIFARSLER